MPEALGNDGTPQQFEVDARPDLGLYKGPQKFQIKRFYFEEVYDHDTAAWRTDLKDEYTPDNFDFIICADGAAPGQHAKKKNDKGGPCGAGVIIFFRDGRTLRAGKYFPNATNNLSEAAAHHQMMMAARDIVRQLGPEARGCAIGDAANAGRQITGEYSVNKSGGDAEAARHAPYIADARDLWSSVQSQMVYARMNANHKMKKEMWNPADEVASETAKKGGDIGDFKFRPPAERHLGATTLPAAKRGKITRITEEKTTRAVDTPPQPGPGQHFEDPDPAYDGPTYRYIPPRDWDAWAARCADQLKDYGRDRDMRGSLEDARAALAFLNLPKMILRRTQGYTRTAYKNLKRQLAAKTPVPYIVEDPPREKNAGHAEDPTDDQHGKEWTEGREEAHVMEGEYPTATAAGLLAENLDGKELLGGWRHTEACDNAKDGKRAPTHRGGRPTARPYNCDTLWTSGSRLEGSGPATEQHLLASSARKNTRAPKSQYSGPQRPTAGTLSKWQVARW